MAGNHINPPEVPPCPRGDDCFLALVFTLKEKPRTRTTTSTRTNSFIAHHAHQFTNMNSLPFNNTRQVLAMPCFVA